MKNGPDTPRSFRNQDSRSFRQDRTAFPSSGAGHTRRASVPLGAAAVRTRTPGCRSANTARHAAAAAFDTALATRATGFALTGRLRQVAEDHCGAIRVGRVASNARKAQVVHRSGHCLPAPANSTLARMDDGEVLESWHYPFAKERAGQPSASRMKPTFRPGECETPPSRSNTSSMPPHEEVRRSSTSLLSSTATSTNQLSHIPADQLAGVWRINYTASRPFPRCIGLYVIAFLLSEGSASPSSRGMPRLASPLAARPCSCSSCLPDSTRPPGSFAWPHEPWRCSHDRYSSASFSARCVALASAWRHFPIGSPTSSGRARRCYPAIGTPNLATEDPRDDAGRGSIRISGSPRTDT